MHTEASRLAELFTDGAGIEEVEVELVDISHGSLAMDAGISHKGSSLLLNVSNLSGKDIVILHGTSAYNAKPFNVQLAAAVDGDGAFPWPLPGPA